MSSTPINDLAAHIHEVSTDHGFSAPTMQNLPEKLMLSVSELSEALEEHRDDRLYWHQHEAGCPQGPPVHQNTVCNCNKKPEGVLVEIADSVIRNLHMMHSLLEEAKAIQGDPVPYTVGSIITEKVAYNRSRPYKHGRAY